MSITDDLLRGSNLGGATAPPAYQATQAPYTPPAYHPPSQGYQNTPAPPAGNSQPNTFAPMIRDDDPTYPINAKLYVAFHIRKGTPPDIVDRVKAIATSLLNSRFSVRYNVTGDPAIDPILVDTLANMRTVNTEVDLITPWKDFGKEFMPLTPKLKQPSYMAKRHTAAYMRNWVDAKPAMRSFKAAETNLVIGRSAPAPAVAMLTWSEDASEHVGSLTQETKYSKHVYALCAAMNVPILNLRSPDAIERLDRILNKYPPYQD